MMQVHAYVRPPIDAHDSQSVLLKSVTSVRRVQAGFLIATVKSLEL